MVKKRRVVRREVGTIPVYGSPLQLRPYKMSDLGEGSEDPLQRKVSYTGEVVPKTQNISGRTYYFYKRVGMRRTAKMVVDKLRKQGYYARVFQVKRHLGRRAIVVDNAVYTRPRHPQASSER